jgi:hypothetical protein
MMNMNKYKFKKITIWQRSLAIFFIVIGLAGIVLPILPGWPFIFWGLFLLGGIGLVDQLFLKYLPEKYRGIVIMWLEKFDKK